MYNLKSNSEAEMIEILQTFFYSLEFGDIKKILFIPRWLDMDKQAKEKFLKQNNDLAKLSDNELREAFSLYTPKSDWDRFFSEKTDIPNIDLVLYEIQYFRNIIAHYKFFYKNDYNKCFNSFNIVIKVTENKDFSKKNDEYLRENFKNIFEPLIEALKPFQELRETIEQSFSLASEPLTSLKESFTNL